MKTRITRTLLLALFDDYWKYELQQDPFNATFSGDYRFND